MKTKIAALIAFALIIAACATPEPTPTPPPPTATLAPTHTSVPTPTTVPTVALPTLTPSPVPNPAAAFLEWLATRGYEFLVNVNDGSRRYIDPSEQKTVAVDVFPSRVSAGDIVFDSVTEASVLYESTQIAMAAVQIYGYDAAPIRSAISLPFEYPLTLQLPGYLFLLEKEDSELYSYISASVTFFESE